MYSTVIGELCAARGLARSVLLLGLFAISNARCGSNPLSGDAGEVDSTAVVPDGSRSDASAPPADGSRTDEDAASVDAAHADAMHLDAGDTASSNAGPPPPDPCVEAGNCPTGAWINVTPTTVNITDNLDCGNFGTQSVGVDPNRPSDFYAEFMCQGIWKSTDYGQTWTGPINVGRNGTAAGDCAGGITVADGGPGNPPIIYEACIRGSIGFWSSTNGGIDWDNYDIPMSVLPQYQDLYPVSVDPYNALHLIATGHEKGYLIESHDGGQTWTGVPMVQGMNAGCMSCGTAFAFFLDTGSADTTAQTWLWIAQFAGGTIGTWRTTNGGGTWTLVDMNEHPHGTSQIYNPPGGTVYMAGSYSAEGMGVLRSTDLGQTWANVSNEGEAIVWGTPANVYSAYSWANGLGHTDPTNFVIGANDGAATWAPTPTPAGMIEGPAQVATSFDGSHHILVGACWWAGIWRYIEP